MSAVADAPATVRTDERPEPGNKPQHGSFTVEFGNHWANNFTINTLQRRVRGKFSIMGLFKRKDEDGKDVGGRPTGDIMSQMPPVPGLQMKVDMGKGVVYEHDPLSDDKELCDAIEQRMKSGGAIGDYRVKPWPDRKVDLQDEHTTKTLVRELALMVKNGNASLEQGTIPKPSEVDNMPGYYLHDPGNTNQDKFRFQWEYDLYISRRRSLHSA